MPRYVGPPCSSPQRRLKSAPAFAGPEQQKRLDNLIVQSVFKQGEQKAAAGEHSAAAAAYLRAAREFPKEPRAAQAGMGWSRAIHGKLQ